MGFITEGPACEMFQTPVFKYESREGSSVHQYKTVQQSCPLPCIPSLPLLYSPSFTVAAIISLLPHVYYFCYRAQEGVCTGLL